MPDSSDTHKTRRQEKPRKAHRQPSRHHVSRKVFWKRLATGTAAAAGFVVAVFLRRRK